MPSREPTRLSAEGERGKPGQRGAGPPHELVGASYERGDMLASPSSCQSVNGANFERFTQGGSADLGARGWHGGNSERGSLGKALRIYNLWISNRSRVHTSWPERFSGDSALCRTKRKGQEATPQGERLGSK